VARVWSWIHRYRVNRRGRAWQDPARSAVAM